MNEILIEKFSLRSRRSMGIPNLFGEMFGFFKTMVVAPFNSGFKLAMTTLGSGDMASMNRSAGELLATPVPA